MSRDNGKPSNRGKSTRNEAGKRTSAGSRSGKPAARGAKSFDKKETPFGRKKTVRGVKTSFTEPKEEKLFSKKEFKPYDTTPEKKFSKPKSGKSFDARDKYEKGDLKFGKKTFKKFDKEEDKAKSFVQRRRLEKLTKSDNKDTIRLNKYIANSGICSRREADDLIIQGLVEVNGKVVTEMGYQVQKTDRVVFDGQGITPEKPVYVLLNKPKGYISTTKDEKARKTVMELVANASPYRVFPVGRLDRSTTGVILLTNDGHLTKKLTHPSFNMKKIYHVTLDRKLDRADLNTILEGVRLEEGVAEVDSISYIDGKPKNEVGIEIHIGWNRVVRRIFQKLGYEVEALDRVMFAGLTKKNIKRGHWRILTELEVNNLKML